MTEIVDSKSLAEKAAQLDLEDDLKSFRDDFHVPLQDNGNPEVYFVGNSLGLQPRQTEQYILADLESWRTRGVRGHFEGEYPWMPYHEFLADPMAQIVGGHADEVVMMNGLTANLHLMMASFYRPTQKRSKVLIEAHAFPSDHYAVESQIRWQGFDPGKELIALSPEKGEELIANEKILQAIDYYRDSLAMILLPGVQYYTGQIFDMPAIVSAAKQFEIPVGFDLAHAAGNIDLHLHDWEVDFAVWCSYKYLNAGPGSVAGCFVHQKHARNTRQLRLAGWWGHDKDSRFLMENRFQPIPTAEGWQLSNPPILSLSAVRASLDVFKRAGMQNLVNKSKSLTAYFVECLDNLLATEIEIVTPRDPQWRGCQLSLKVLTDAMPGKVVYERLEEAAIRTDWREPNIIRAAPVPLYNTHHEVFQFVKQLQDILAS